MESVAVSVWGCILVLIGSRLQLGSKTAASFLQPHPALTPGRGHLSSAPMILLFKKKTTVFISGSERIASDER